MIRRLFPHPILSLALVAVSIMCSMWCRACRSDPQIPQARVRTRICPGPGVRSATSSQTSCLLRRMTARMGPPSDSFLKGHHGPRRRGRPEGPRLARGRPIA